MDEDQTRLITRKSNHLSDDTDKTMAIGGGSASSNESDGHTKLYRPSRGSAAAGQETLSAGKTSDGPEDPVVGWLVVVDGPGKGKSVQLGYGMNSIGRAADERASISFGDEEISRKGHASLVYDPRGKKFYLQHGEGTNLTYVGDQPVLQPTELQGGETIGLGNTQLVFVPFCGQHFDWQD